MAIDELPNGASCHSDTPALVHMAAANALDSLTSNAPGTQLVALQSKLNVLTELSRELQNVRSFTKNLLQPHSGEPRKSFASLDAFSANVLSPEIQKALNTASSSEREDGNEVDDYRRALTKPALPTR